MANGYVPVNAGELIENPKRRKIVYKIVGWIGLAGTLVTLGLAPFGITQEVAPWLLSFWSIFGAVSKWSNVLADKNVVLPPSPYRGE